jgi:hypothetical protein
MYKFYLKFMYNRDYTVPVWTETDPLYSYLSKRYMACYELQKIL